MKKFLIGLLAIGLTAFSGICAVAGDITEHVGLESLFTEDRYEIYIGSAIINDWTERFTCSQWNTIDPIGIAGKTNDRTFNHMKIYQIYGGYRLLPKLDLDAAFTMMWTDPAPFNFGNNNMGNGFDISATYKFYGNFSYKFAFGYLWSGSLFKGMMDINSLGEDWLLMHKLTLTF